MRCPECLADCPDRSKECAACGLIFRRWITWGGKTFQKERGFDMRPDAAPAPPGPPALYLAALIVLSLLAGLGVRLAVRQEHPPAERRPSVVAFWTARNKPSQRVMAILNSVRRRYRPEELDVIGFYLGDADAAAILRSARREGYTATLAAAKHAPAMIDLIASRFPVRDPGQAIFVVDGQGRVQRVEAGSSVKSAAAIEASLDDILWKSFRELRDPARVNFKTL